MKIVRNVSLKKKKRGREIVRDFDFLVIGAGIAGLSAARVLARSGRVAVISKGALKESSTHYAQGGIAVAMQESDAPGFHLEDTLVAGDGLCDEEMVRLLVEEGPRHVADLIGLGANFDSDDRGLLYTQEAAHGKRRILHAGDATGREIEKTLGRALLADANVEFFSNTSVLELLIEDGNCLGAVASGPEGLVVFGARATLLASGGCGQIFKRNTNPTLATGDGIALAYRAGCAVQDMEFVQFHPTTLYLGDKKPISLFLISEAVRGEGAVLRNRDGERFMTRYHDLAELAPRDVVARAIWEEMRSSETGCVYLDLSGLSVDIPKRFPTIYQRCLDAKIDITKDFIPVAPAAHYCIGGVKTDEFGGTDVRRLFAAGEVSATGIHGANRLASNSLLEGLVFGARAAEVMAVCGGFSDGILKQVQNEEGESRVDSGVLMGVKQRVREVMWGDVGILRDGDGLARAGSVLSELAEMVSAEEYNADLKEVQNMVLVAQLCVRAAREREESRGAHFRTDFPYKIDGDWQRHIVYRREGMVKCGVSAGGAPETSSQ